MGEEDPASSVPPPTEVPLARAFVIHGFRTSSVELWGEEGLRAIAAALPRETRERTVDELLLAVAWTPVVDVMAWYEAVWDGPAKRQGALFARFLDRSVESGFARVRRDFLKLGPMQHLVPRFPGLWRRQHTHGELSVVLAEPGADGVARGAITTLRDNPLVETALSRLALAWSWRKIISLTGVRNVKETHEKEGDALVARFTWSP